MAPTPAKFRVVLTAGGTKEPIDDVRYVTNFSTGKFGYEIARALAAAGCEVTVISAPETPFLAGGPIPGVRHLSFTDTESLREALLGEAGADIVFHAAAVSDFRPAHRVHGKISSAANELTVRLERTPKIIDELREAYGKRTMIIGFKLLSGMSWRDLVRRGREQNARCGLNLTVANDLRQVRDGRHPVTLVTVEGGAIRLDGARREVAEKIAAFVLKRAAVDWFRTEHHAEPAPIIGAERLKIGRLIDLAQRLGLLTDRSGNASVRETDSIIVTPRQLDKSRITAEHACLAAVDLGTRVIRSQGPSVKPSIDTGVQEMIYRARSGVDRLLHFHSPWGRYSRRTSFPYPCGTVQEGNEIVAAIGGGSGEFALELAHHGAIIGLTGSGVPRLEAEFSACASAYRTHLSGIGLEGILSRGRLRPVFSDASVVGVVLELGEAVSVFLAESARGRGIGQAVVRQIIDRQLDVVTVEACDVLAYYEALGFVGDRDPRTGLWTLRPPDAPPTDDIFK